MKNYIQLLHRTSPYLELKHRYYRPIDASNMQQQHQRSTLHMEQMTFTIYCTLCEMGPLRSCTPLHTVNKPVIHYNSLKCISVLIIIILKIHTNVIMGVHTIYSWELHAIPYNGPSSAPHMHAQLKPMCYPLSGTNLTQTKTCYYALTDTLSHRRL